VLPGLSRIIGRGSKKLVRQAIRVGTRNSFRAMILAIRIPPHVEFKSLTLYSWKRLET